MKCEKGKKLDFIKDVFTTLEMTQTFVFVNTKRYAELIYNKLVEAGFAAYILFAKMTPKERDECMDKFRKQEYNVLITTNMIARGVDVPEAQFVINYDVPVERNFEGK